MTITYPTQWDAGDGVNDVQMRPMITPVPVAVDAKWTLSNFTIAATFLDASAVAAASYAQRYIPGVLEGHQHKLTVVVDTLSGDNEVQTVSIDNASSGGTFTLSLGAETTGTINWNAAAADVKTALELLTAISLVSVTGGPGPSSDWVIEFQGIQAGEAVVALVGDGALLTGGTTVVGVAETTRGGGALAVTMGGVTVGTIYVAGTSVYYIRPTDGEPLKITTTDTSTTASITSIVVEGVDPWNIDLIPEVTPVQV